MSTNGETHDDTPIAPPPEPPETELPSESVEIAYQPPGRSIQRLTLVGPEGDHILKQVRTTGTFYEVDLLRALERELPVPQGLVLDVGANLGNHTLFFVRVLGAKVLAIEPSELACGYLRTNLKDNGIEDSVEVIKAAAAAKNGHLFLDEPEPHNLGTVQVSELPRGGGSSQVVAAPLDRIVRNSALAAGQRVTLIKIDVEGFEEQVLAGAEHILRNDVPAVVVEARNERDQERVVRWMADRGYSVAGPYSATPTFVFTKDSLTTNTPFLRLIERHMGQIDLRICALQLAVEQLGQRNDSLTGEFESQKMRSQDLEREIRDMRRSVHWQVGDAMIAASRPSLDTLRLPKRLFDIWRHHRLRVAEAGGEQNLQGGAEVDRRHREFYADFDRFVDWVRTHRYPYFVIMYGGTTYIQDIRANRPIRLTRSLIRENVPVLFNFHRWRTTEHIPPYENPLLFQSPIDLTPGLVRRLVGDSLGGARRLFVVSYPHPSVSRLINLANVDGWATLYDCRDDWSEFAKVGAAKWYQEKVEKFVVNNCDLSCCVSRPLVKKMQRFSTSREVRLLPNAYDPNFLSPDYERRPSEKVKIGYFGHLTDRWFDWDSLVWIARQRPRYHFDIIGHGAPEPLDLPPNIQMHGPMKHPEICAMASEWRVGIIPFRPSRLADGVDPIKIYEYFGLGLPVVSFRMPQIADYPYTQTVETREEFVQALDQAAETTPSAGVLERFLDRNTWEGRARQLLDWTDEILGHPPAEKAFRTDRTA